MNNTAKIIIGLLILIILGGGVYIYSQNTGEVVVDNDTATTTNNGTSTSTSTAPVFTKVKIAVLTMPGKDNDELKGCDKVSLREITVASTTTPLNAALSALFTENIGWPYGENSSGNFIPTQKDLSFDWAEVKDGVAKVYLQGKTGPFGGVCDDPRTKIQIEETAKQFPTVKSVEIYLNGVKTNLTPSLR